MSRTLAPEDCSADDRLLEKSVSDNRALEAAMPAESSMHDKDLHSNERKPSERNSSAMPVNERDVSEMRADARLSSTTWQTRAIAHEPQWRFGLLAGIFAMHLLLLVLALTVFAPNLSDKTEPPAPLEMVTVELTPPPTLEIGDPNADPALSTTREKTPSAPSAMASASAVKTSAQQPDPQLHSASMPQTPRVPAQAEKMPASAPAEKNQNLSSAAVSSVGSAPAASANNSERAITAASSASSGASSSTSNASGGSASGGDAGGAQSASGTDGTSTSPPRYGVAYLNNPPPKYPTLSRRMGEQGRVLLRVFVSASGAAKEVRLQRSCGYDALDEAAMAAVRKWRFVPAKKGGSSVEAWVNVPIVFTLD